MLMNKLLTFEFNKRKVTFFSRFFTLISIFLFLAKLLFFRESIALDLTLLLTSTFALTTQIFLWDLVNNLLKKLNIKNLTGENRKYLHLLSIYFIFFSILGTGLIQIGIPVFLQLQSLRYNLFLSILLLLMGIIFLFISLNFFIRFRNIAESCEKHREDVIKTAHYFFIFSIILGIGGENIVTPLVIFFTILSSIKYFLSIKTSTNKNKKHENLLFNLKNIISLTHKDISTKKSKIERSFWVNIVDLKHSLNFHLMLCILFINSIILVINIHFIDFTNIYQIFFIVILIITISWSVISLREYKRRKKMENRFSLYVSFILFILSLILIWVYPHSHPFTDYSINTIYSLYGINELIKSGFQFTGWEEYPVMFSRGFGIVYLGLFTSLALGYNKDKKPNRSQITNYHDLTHYELFQVITPPVALSFILFTFSFFYNSIPPEYYNISNDHLIIYTFIIATLLLYLTYFYVVYDGAKGYLILSKHKIKNVFQYLNSIPIKKQANYYRKYVKIIVPIITLALVSQIILPISYNPSSHLLSIPQRDTNITNRSGEICNFYANHWAKIKITVHSNDTLLFNLTDSEHLIQSVTSTESNQTIQIFQDNLTNERYSLNYYLIDDAENDMNFTLQLEIYRDPPRIYVIYPPVLPTLFLLIFAFPPSLLISRIGKYSSRKRS